MVQHDLKVNGRNLGKDNHTYRWHANHSKPIWGKWYAYRNRYRGHAGLGYEK